MRTAQAFRRKPVQACVICGARLKGASSPGDTCPSCGQALELSRLYREAYEDCPVDRIMARPGRR